jgi:DNA-binding IclR family transcriptional regulator
MPKKNTTFNASERLLHILMHISASPTPLIAQQISDETGIPLSSLYRYLSILKEWQLLEEDPITKRFFSGAASMQLSRNFLQFSTLPDQLRPLLKSLQRDTGEMSAFMVAVGYQALCVESIESPYALRCSYEKGKVSH